MKKFGHEEYSAYWKNVHADTADDLAAVCFPGKSKYYNAFFHRTQIAAFEWALRDAQLDLRGKRLLDVGCGRGRWLRFFKKRFQAEPVGIDLSEDAIRACVSAGLDARVASVTGQVHEVAARP